MVDDLFTPRPEAWGLPADALLWDAMEAALDGEDLSEDTALGARLHALYEALVGQPLSQGDAPVRVERFCVDAVSSGLISPVFWREEAIPLLEQRFALRGGGGTVLWWRRDGATFYDIPEHAELQEGAIRIWRPNGQHRDVSEAALMDFELSREEAGRRIAQLLLTVPTTGRAQLQRLLDQVSHTDFRQVLDVGTVVEGVESFLEGTGLLRPRSTPAQDDAQAGDDDGAETPRDRVRGELRATLGRFGAQLQRFGQRLQDLAEDEEPT